MSVLSIIAAIECDGCGKHFRVEMEPAHKTWHQTSDGGVATHYGSLFDAAVDAVRGGIIAPSKDDAMSMGSSSVRAEKLLCPVCTKRADEACAESPTGKHSWEDDDVCEHCGEAM